MNFLYVFIGGGTGAVLRYLVSEAWKHMQGSSAVMIFPWPTLIVNVLGCFLISLFYTNSAEWGLSPEVRLLLTTGLCGGFTTFSTLGWESLNMLRSGMYGSFALYVLLSLVLGIGLASIPVLLKS
ncbi:MAG: fluoride efflux transporter CrcB [Bacteroidales bacterium]|nr:fluoride efflux transporter CrcB [Bacteroidales bacterium]